MSTKLDAKGYSFNRMKLWMGRNYERTLIDEWMNISNMQSIVHIMLRLKKK